MKFEEIKNLQAPKKKYSKKELKKSTGSLNIKSIRRYNELAVILMYPETKGSLRALSVLVNDGNKPCSWTSRITFHKDEWEISIAPYSEIDKANIIINVFDEMNKKFGNMNGIYVNGNLHVVFLKTHSKELAEKIINHAITIFSNNKILGIRKFNIDQKFNIHNTDNKYKLIYNYKPKQKNKSIIKNKTLVSSIKKQTISKEDKPILLILEEKINKGESIEGIDLEQLNTLSAKYCSDKERLQIAIKFMS